MTEEAETTVDPAMLMALARRLTQSSTSENVRAILAGVAQSPMDGITRRQILNEVKARTSMPLATLQPFINRARLAIGPGRDWLQSAVLTDTGAAKPILQNVALALRNDPAWGGVITYDAFALRIMITKPPPWAEATDEWTPAAWTDIDDLRATEWMQTVGIHATERIIGPAVQLIAAEHEYHPVREYLTALKWDSVARLDRWLTHYVGVVDTPFARMAGSKWCISAIARVMAPGCKVDHILVIQGEQGILKSGVFAVLGGLWYTDDMPDLHNQKDAAIAIAGVWIIEHAELDVLVKADMNRVKAYASRQIDRYRPPYGRNIITAPRQCVFGGTVNHTEYLRDPTGARRFWPVTAVSIDLDSLRQDRDQIWAEAYMRYTTGERWWIEEPDMITHAKEAQEERRERDAWEEPIGKFLSEQFPQDIAISDVYNTLSIEKARWDTPSNRRISSCLRQHGWERYQRRQPDGRREWRYRPKNPTTMTIYEEPIE